MKVWKKITVSLGILIVGVSLAIVGLFIYATSDVCGNEVYAKELSPNREHKVVVFQRDCGATTGFNTQISIIDPADELENQSGNIYIIDGHPKDVAPHLSWASNSELRIHRRLNGSEYKSELSWGSLNKVKITYGALSSLQTCQNAAPGVAPFKKSLCIRKVIYENP